MWDVRSACGMLAQQGSQDKASAIPKGWEEIRAGQDAQTCLLLTSASPTFMDAVVIPQNNLRAWEPLQSLLSVSIIKYQPLALGSGA